MNQMSILERRRIEALVLKNVYEVIRERSGEDEAQAAIGEAVSRSAIEQGKSFADELGRTPTIQDFADIQPLWTKENALEIDVISQGEDHFDFNVTRCRYSEMYRDMGLGHIGHLLSCNRDGDFCIGYNPAMKLERTQTIMKGASHCDFRYRLEQNDTKDGKPDMPVENWTSNQIEELVAFRRDLHQNPELLYDVNRTAEKVAEALRAAGVDEVVTGIGRTGVVGVIRGQSNRSGRAIGLRADMDALPILEETGAEWSSKVPGKMHACGHDGHTTMLLALPANWRKAAPLTARSS